MNLAILNVDENRSIFMIQDNNDYLILTDKDSVFDYLRVFDLVIAHSGECGDIPHLNCAFDLIVGIAADK